jgi:hypothetical protein
MLFTERAKKIQGKKINFYWVQFFYSIILQKEQKKFKAKKLIFIGFNFYFLMINIYFYILDIYYNNYQPLIL